jgi:hypothetical protein
MDILLKTEKGACLALKSGFPASEFHSNIQSGIEGTDSHRRVMRHHAFGKSCVISLRRVMRHHAVSAVIALSFNLPKYIAK